MKKKRNYYTPGQVAARERWKKNNPDYYKYLKHRSQWRCRRGIDPEEFYERILEQNCRCAVCGEPLDPPSNVGSKGAVLDHDHITGKNRGVLHRKCNLGIGNLGDNPKLVRLALEYLEFWENQ